MDISVLDLNQRELVRLGLDVNDAVIFCYICLKISQINRECDTGIFNLTTVLDYSEIISDLPSLRVVSKRSIARRIDNLVRGGVVCKRLIENNIVQVTVNYQAYCTLTGKEI